MTDIPQDFPAPESDLPIEFFSEDIAFELHNSKAIFDWIHQVTSAEQKSISKLTYVFCSDKYLLELNIKYLNHDTLTDIITFGYEEGNEAIEGDIFISIERVQENAKLFQTSVEMELNRVIIHGVLHLCGYKDKSEEEANLMREKENEALELFATL